MIPHTQCLWKGIDTPLAIPDFGIRSLEVQATDSGDRLVIDQYPDSALSISRQSKLPDSMVDRSWPEISGAGMVFTCDEVPEILY